MSARKSVLTPNFDAAVDLTKKQAAFVDVATLGSSPTNAMKVVYGPGSGADADRLMKLPKITQALLNKRAENAYMLGLSRDKVLQGFLDAIDQAKLMADPMAQIAAWREVAKVCGFYAPEVKKIELSGSAQRVIDRMQQLSDKELLEIAGAEDIDFVEMEPSP